MKCPSCEMVAINGVPCHEQGCPDSWRFVTRECGWCGTEFKPESMGDRYCSQDCYETDNWG